MKPRKLMLWLFLGAGFCLGLKATSDPSKFIFYLAIGILIYAALLKRAPDSARGWLSIGGALSGAMIVASLGLSVVFLFRDGYNVLGLAIVSGLLLAAVGAVLGFLFVGYLTEPPKGDARSANENS